MGCSCGIPSPEECQAMSHAALIWETQNNDYAIHRLRSFAYGLQHPDHYLVSPKTFAAHLLGVCIGLEYDNDQNLFNHILRTLKLGTNFGEMPPKPEHYGDLTIAYVTNAKTAAEYERLVEEYASAVWKAYQVFHKLTHDWIGLCK